MTKPNYRTDAMSQTAFSPPRFLLSSASDHPPTTTTNLLTDSISQKAALSPDATPPPSAPIPPRCFCYLQGSIKGRKEGDQVPYFSCRSWWKVSLAETHSGRDPPVIMFQTRHAKKGGSAGAGNEAFLRLAGAKRSSRRERRRGGAVRERRSGDSSSTDSQQHGQRPLPAHQPLPHIQLTFPEHKLAEPEKKRTHGWV